MPPEDENIALPLSASPTYMFSLLQPNKRAMGSSVGDLKDGAAAAGAFFAARPGAGGSFDAEGSPALARGELDFSRFLVISLT